jgi:hypothetical protein
MTFDYAAPAEPFMTKRKGGSRHPPLVYRRFASAAEAIRFAIEEFPAVHTLGVRLQVDDQRFDSDDIQRLYTSIRCDDKTKGEPSVGRRSSRGSDLSLC